MSLEKLIDKIRQDGLKQADVIKKDSLIERQRILKQAELEAEKKKNDIIQSGLQEAKSKAEHIITIAKLEARKEILSAKQKLIDICFEKAKNDILTMDNKSYHRLIKELILTQIDKKYEDFILILSEKDNKRLNPAVLIKEITLALKEKGRNVRIELSNQPGSFNTGFMLKKDKQTKNFSLDMIFRIKRSDWEIDIAEILFL